MLKTPRSDFSQKEKKKIIIFNNPPPSSLANGPFITPLHLGLSTHSSRNPETLNVVFRRNSITQSNYIIMFY